MTCICHAATVREDGLALLEEAGHVLARHIEFEDEAEYAAVLRHHAHQALVFQHAHAEEEFEPQRYWMDRALLQRLNNKATLPELVPADRRPRRLDRPVLPCVVKRATEWTTGGGRSVRIWHEAFGRLEDDVIEEFVEFEETYCLQFGAKPGGTIVDLGFAPQVVTPAGRFLGSRFDIEQRLPADMLDAGRAIMKRATALGYRGIAGFDAGILADGRFLFFDLNFRLNGSSAPLCHLSTAADWLQTGTLRSGTWRLPSLEVAREAFLAHRFWPLSTYVDGTDCRVSGFIPSSRSARSDPRASFPRP